MSKLINQSGYRSQNNKDCITLLNCNMAYIGFLRVLRFPPGPSVSYTNKTDRHDITETLLKVALNTIKQTYSIFWGPRDGEPYSYKIV